MYAHKCVCSSILVCVCEYTGVCVLSILMCEYIGVCVLSILVCVCVGMCV